MMRHANLSLFLMAFLGGCAPLMEEFGDEHSAEDGSSEASASATSGGTTEGEGQSSSSSGTMPSTSKGSDPGTAASSDGGDEGTTSVGDTSSSDGSDGRDPTTTSSDETGSTTSGLDERALCEMTRGIWEEAGCGHTACGVTPDCQDPTPGCNCGPGQTFDRVQGCFPDDACTDPAIEARLCEASGGAWDHESCGHYVCGVRPLCRAAIPGCDCGANNVFEPGEGCVEEPACSREADAYLCEETGGVWDPRSCGHYECGEAPACDAVIPGCDCGEGQNFGAGIGCYEDPYCSGEEGREGEVCDPEASHCGEGLACCYPCGIEGCAFECTVADEGECPPPRP